MHELVVMKDENEKTLFFVFDFDNEVCEVQEMLNEKERKVLFSTDIDNLKEFMEKTLNFLKKNGY